METLTLHSNKSNMYTLALRIIFGLMGCLYLFAGANELLSGVELSFFNVAHVVLGGGLIITVIINPKFGGTVELTLNNDFIRIREGEHLTRTAYWNRIKDIKLTAISIRIQYTSGMPERFKLPFMDSKRRKELKKWLITVSNKHEIQFAEKAWWKPF
ncbi:MAG: hypothetical protein JXR26_09625 [Balneolaceae bacterium]|nr:hypothetical protein [Balneolaceae bacterium]